VTLGNQTDPRRELGWAVAGWVIGAAVFFRDQLTSGFGTVTGDLGDVRLVVFLHEHWWQVWHGDRPWRTPPMFHPQTGVLAYSDTFVLDQVLYTPLRLIGVEPFLAYQLCLLALTAVGYASLYRILRRHLGLPVAIACCLAAAGAFANNLYVDSGHTQMFAANVIPAVLLLAIEAWRAESVGRGVAYSSAAGLLLALLLWSTFYLGWFAVVVGGLAALVAAGAIVVSGGGRALVASVAARRWRVVAAGGGFGLGMIGFLTTYWSAITDGRTRSYAEVAGFAPRPADLFNVGRDHVVWGWLLRLVDGDDERLVLLHRAVAVTPILLAAACAAGVVAAVRQSRRSTAADRSLAVAGLATGVTCVVLALLPIQWPFGGAWAWLHRFVPGGDAIRVYGRVEVVNSAVACLAVGCGLALLGSDRRRVAVAATALCALIAVEQVNLTDNFRRLDRANEVAVLGGIPDPPSACATFHVVPAPDRNPDHASIDAMLIAQRVGIPTVNGYSGWEPPGWRLRPDSDAYLGNVAAWVAERGLAPRHCSYDAVTSRWSAPGT
jgi:hypothetical protein